MEIILGIDVSTKDIAFSEIEVETMRVHQTHKLTFQKGLNVEQKLNTIKKDLYVNMLLDHLIDFDWVFVERAFYQGKALLNQMNNGYYDIVGLLTNLFDGKQIIPSEWQSQLDYKSRGLSVSEKKKLAIKTANGLFPHSEDYLKDNDICDATLIAFGGWLKYGTK